METAGFYGTICIFSMIAERDTVVGAGCLVATHGETTSKEGDKQGSVTSTVIFVTLLLTISSHRPGFVSGDCSA